MMMADSFFSLLQPALETDGITITSIGFLAGSILMYGSDLFIPHEYFLKASGENKESSRLMKIIAAMTLHNLPEGFSVGVVFGSGNIKAA